MSYAIEHVTDYRGLCERCGKDFGIRVKARVFQKSDGWYSTDVPINIPVKRCDEIPKPSGYPHDAFSTDEDFYHGGPLQGGVRQP